jgi:uncharacterized membrane protein YsdA (DUF1294 family)
MNQSQLVQFLLGWVVLTSVWAFGLFGFDKWRAGRNRGQRIAESSLLLSSALGGWPGGFLGMLLFRHKSAKPSFQWKFTGVLFVWLALVIATLKVAGVF